MSLLRRSEYGRHLWDLLPQPTPLLRQITAVFRICFRRLPTRIRLCYPLCLRRPFRPRSKRRLLATSSRSPSRRYNSRPPMHFSEFPTRPVRLLIRSSRHWRTSDPTQLHRPRDRRSMQGHHSPINWPPIKAICKPRKCRRYSIPPHLPQRRLVLCTTCSHVRALYLDAGGLSRCGISLDATRFLNFQWPSSRITMSS